MDYLNKEPIMSGKIISLLLVLFAVLLSGCVERELTINTDPAGASVTLNDQEIGTTPVTVSFLWYGDYYVKITKDGYETLNEVKTLKAPLHDRFPFDFFAQVLNPAKITDRYQWDFALQPYQRPGREEMLESAESLRQEAIFELD